MCAAKAHFLRCSQRTVTRYLSRHRTSRSPQPCHRRRVRQPPQQASDLRPSGSCLRSSPPSTACSACGASLRPGIGAAMVPRSVRRRRTQSGLGSSPKLPSTSNESPRRPARSIRTIQWRATHIWSRASLSLEPTNGPRDWVLQRLVRSLLVVLVPKAIEAALLRPEAARGLVGPDPSAPHSAAGSGSGLLAHRAHAESRCQNQIQGSGGSPILKCRVGRGCRPAGSSV